MAFDRPFPGSSEGAGRVVEDGDLTAEVTSDVLNTKGLRELTVLAGVTRPAAGVSAVQTMIDGSLDGTTFFPLQDKEETATPVKTLDEESESKAIPGTGLTSWASLITVIAPFMRFRFTATGGAAGDVIDVDVAGRS